MHEYWMIDQDARPSIDHRLTGGTAGKYVLCKQHCEWKQCCIAVALLCPSETPSRTEHDL